MAGPQMQREHQQQRPSSEYYTTTRSQDNGISLGTSASYTGLYALRQVSNEGELIYRGTNNNTLTADLGGNISNGGGSVVTASTSRGILHRSITTAENKESNFAALNNNISSIAVNNNNSENTSKTSVVLNAEANLTPSFMVTNSNKQSSSAQTKTRSGPRTQRSVEIIVDATNCTDGTDIEQGQTRKSSRHRRRPLHRRFLNYLRNLFQGNTATHGKS